MATSTLGSGTLVLAGTTSGTTTVTATAVAGTTTLTLPAATDTLVGKATTDTLTNKTLTGAVMNGTLGATTPSTVAATTLTTSSTVTHNGGTANGVPYLDGSKVLTTGSALVFDGTNLGVGVTPSAWGGGYKAFEVNAGSISATTGAGNLIVSNNSYFNGTNFIYKATGVSSDHVQTGGQHWFRTAASGTAGNAISFTQAMTLDASGNLGITETSPTAKLHISVASAVVDGTKGVKITNPGGTAVMFECGVSGDSFIGTTSGSDFNIRTGNTVRATFDTAGNLLVGTTAAVLSGKLTTNFTGNTINGATFNDTGNGNGAGFIIFAESGTAIGSISRVGTTSAVAYNTTSDYRLKTVTGAVTGQGSRIDALKPIDYLWKDGGQQARGFLAHEFQTVYPNSVTGDKDAVDADGNPKHQSMQASSSEVIADLVAEIQSLRTRITALESA